MQNPKLRFFSNKEMNLKSITDITNQTNKNSRVNDFLMKMIGTQKNVVKTKRSRIILQNKSNLSE